MHKAWYWVGGVLYWFPRSSIKFQGHTAKKIRRFRPKLGVSGLYPQSEFTDGYEMMHKDSIEEAPYCFSRLSVKFQGHGAKKYRFWPKIGIFRTVTPVQFTDVYEMMLKSWSSIEEVPYCFSRSSVKFQGHKGQISLILSGIECFRTVTPVWIHRWLWNNSQSLK